MGVLSRSAGRHRNPFIARTKWMSRAASAAALLTALVLAHDGAAVGGPALEGTWYVLVHYKNSLTANPDADRWLDFVWTFEMAGSHLRWTQYPIVVFDGTSGRFELTRSGRFRTLAAWEPDEAGWSYLAEGPRVNKRGSKSKTLRGSDTRGWSSSGRQAAISASVFTYEESWTITAAAEGGIIRIDDVVSSGMSEGEAEGRTQFDIEQASADEFRGSYDRDGTRVGTFQMRRVGAIRSLKSSEDGRSPNQRLWEKQRQALLEQLEQSIAEGSFGGQAWPWEQEETFPSIGSPLDQVIAGLRARPEADINIILQKLLVFRVDTDPWQEIGEEEALSGTVEAAGTYAVMANRYCMSLGEKDSGQWRSVDWFLLPQNALAAYDYNDLKWQCVSSGLFHPAKGPLGETERQMTDWMSRSFPKGTVTRTGYYQKGLSYLSVGRIEDADKMLAEGGRALHSGAERGTVGARTAAGHETVVTMTEEEMLERALVRGIRAARGVEAAQGREN